MKILFICKYLSTEQNGMESRLATLIKYFKKNNYQVSAITSSISLKKIQFKKPYTLKRINNVNYYHKAEDKEDYGRDYGYDDEVVIKTPSRFNNLSELIEWFNNDYIELLLVNLKELSQSYIYDIL
jgi:hypothetical protein